MWCITFYYGYLWCLFCDSSQYAKVGTLSLKALISSLGHLHLSNSRDNGKLIILGPPILHDNDGGCFYTLRFLLFSGNNFQISETLDLPQRFNDWLTPYGTIVSCNGLICLVHSIDILTVLTMFLYATSQQNNLNFFQNQRWFPHPKWSGHFRFHHGFGFDLETNDYKVVRIICQLRERKSIVEVYSLNMDTWRAMDVILPVDITIFSDPKAPLRDGIYCWLGWVLDSFVENSKKSHGVILSFDFTKEVIGTIEVPADVHHSFKNCDLKLSLIRENIALTECERENWHCTIWVLNEYGVKDSWIKLYMVVLVFFSPLSSLEE
ncbi:hypothetical protein AQUCO_01600122v1 [Aquilegia coerulea]|uniref:F-box associated beta-propeller type 1 domain-containing protein n=1 Tax=Aquilegia coerulea TaxID=218851 RepID=A0A2G5DQ87_AQUCA|nr:hypothetical protein AQUCO_01600122v1 [Aquilegia coerulea]